MAIDKQPTMRTREVGGDILPLEAQELIGRRRGAEVIEVLDVRSALEYLNAHIAGARLLPLSDLYAVLPQLPNDRIYLVYSGTGRRSQLACRLMCTGGLHALNLAGGLYEWLEQGLDIEQG